MEKAYDRLNCYFLYKCFQDLEFSNQWINWIGQCKTTTNFRILVNNKTEPLFNSGRGIRQGDPVSTYLLLFVLNIQVDIFIASLLNRNKVLALNLVKRHLRFLFLCLWMIVLFLVGPIIWRLEIPNKLWTITIRFQGSSLIIINLVFFFSNGVCLLHKEAISQILQIRLLIKLTNIQVALVLKNTKKLLRTST